VTMNPAGLKSKLLSIVKAIRLVMMCKCNQSAQIYCVLQNFNILDAGPLIFMNILTVVFKLLLG
jgi:hypothetical protein